MSLQKGEDLVGGGSRDSGRKEGFDDGRGLMNGRQESCWAVLNSGSKACASEFGRKERLAPGRVVQLATKDERERRELMIVEIFIRRKKVRGVASPKTEGEFGEGETFFQEFELDLTVVEGRKEIKNLSDLPDSTIDDVARELNSPDGAAEEDEAIVSGARDMTIKWIGDVDIGRQSVTVATPHEGLLRVDVETNFWSPRLQQVEGAL